jgi:hypothetical protein
MLLFDQAEAGLDPTGIVGRVGDSCEKFLVFL